MENPERGSWTGLQEKILQPDVVYIALVATAELEFRVSYGKLGLVVILLSLAIFQI